MRKLVFAGSIAAVAALALALGGSVRAGDAKVSVGEAVPDFALVDETGTEHKLSDYRGKLVVLEWTNPDCPFVQRHYSADTMETLSAKFGGQGVVWLAVNSTSGNKPEDTVAWKQAEGFDYPTLQDASGKLGRMFDARTTPHMYVIDAEGVLAYAGAIDDDDRGTKAEPVNYVEGALMSLENGANPDPAETQPYGCSVKYAASTE